MKKHKGLGRGLDSFFREIIVPDGVTNENGSILDCAVDNLVAGKYQPRTFIDPDVLEELASSIRVHGLMQPIVARPIGDGCYEIIAGERRWRAAILAGMDTIPVIIRDVPDEVALPLAIIENVQRESLPPLDEARAIKRLLEEFGMTHQQVSESIGRSRTYVTNLLRLLSLHPDVVELLNGKNIDAGHARALLALSCEDQPVAAQQIIDQSLSVRQTEDMVRSVMKSAAKNSSPKTKNSQVVDADELRIQEQLADLLCAPVSLQKLSGGALRLSIQYDSIEQLDDLLMRLGIFEVEV